MKKQLAVDEEVYYQLVDAIVPNELLDALEGSVNEVEWLEAQVDELPENRQRDLQDLKEYVPALAKVCEWWTAKDSPERRRLQEIFHGPEEV